MDNVLRENVSTWLTGIRPPADDELLAQIRTLEADLLEMQRMLAEIHSNLGRYPERTDEAHALVKTLLDERKGLSTRLGEAVLEWRLRGGNFDLRRRGEPRIPPRVRHEEPPDPEPSHEPATPPPSSQEEAPEPAPVSVDAIKAWKEQMKSRAVPPSRPSETTVASEGKQRAVLVALMQAIGEPRELGNMVNIVDEIDVLEEMTSTERRTQWPMMSKPMQRLWLAMLVARTRAVKDATTTNPGLRERIKAFILHFPAYAKTYQPGYVNGLQVSHNPEHGSWRSDAVQFWAQLKQLSEPPPPPPPAPVEEEPEAPLTLTPATAAPVSPQPASATEEEPETPAIEGDWPLWNLVRDKRGIILGGEPREQPRARLETTFNMAELEWIPGDNPRRLDSVVERVAMNKVDVVFVLQQWTAHKVTNKLIDACKTSNVPWALVSSYSVRAIKQGLERFLGQSRD